MRLVRMDWLGSSLTVCAEARGPGWARQDEQVRARGGQVRIVRSGTVWIGSSEWLGTVRIVSRFVVTVGGLGRLVETVCRSEWARTGLSRVGWERLAGRGGSGRIVAWVLEWRGPGSDRLVGLARIGSSAWNGLARTDVG